MRVRGNSLPDVVDVTAYEPIPGKAEVRVRENITPFSEKDPETGETESGYECAEYNSSRTMRLDFLRPSRRI